MDVCQFGVRVLKWCTGLQGLGCTGVFAFVALTYTRFRATKPICTLLLHFSLAD